MPLRVANYCALRTSALAANRFGAQRCWSAWSGVKQGPPDAILGVTEAFKKDTNPRKMNLGVGAYRDDAGKPFVLKSVLKAEKAINEASLNKEYAPISGEEAFTQGALALALGPQMDAVAGRAATVQSISGTGALRLAGAFVARHYPFEGKKALYLPTPSWGNHKPIFQDSGLEIKQYRYYNPSTCGLDFAGLMQDLKEAPKQSVVLLHACAHNPTGVDLSVSQWEELSHLFKEQSLFPLFDMAYQGFASGDCDRDAAAVRHFVKEGHQIALCQSFAKNMGLYGERVGALTFLGKDVSEGQAILSQMKILVRPMYSSPPIHGARLASTILDTPVLRKEWLAELKAMADRIIAMREALASNLAKVGSQRSWEHITAQIGMFCYSGLTADQCKALKDHHSVYLTMDGRISMAGVTSHNVAYLAESIHAVTK